MSESLSTYDTAKLQIINRLAILCTGLLITLSVLNIIFGNYIGIVIDLVTLILVPIPVLILNNRKRYEQAMYVFLMGYHVLVVTGSYHAIWEGRANEVENFLFPGAIAIIILLNGVGRHLSFLLNFVALVSLNYLRFVFTGKSMAPEFYQLLAMIIVTYIGVYYFIVFFKNQLIAALEKSERLNNQLINKEQALLDSNKSKDRLFSIVAHDLRSPLALVQGLLDPSILNSLEKEKYMEYLSTIRARIGILQETMTNLLSWAQSQLGSLKVNPGNVGLDAEIHSIIDLFADMTKSKGIEITRSGDINSNVYADKNHLNVIVRNIIHNAIKFTPSGGNIKVNVKANGDSVCIAVADSGSGIDDVTKRSILQSKLMESGTGTDGERGSGVGLSFCQDLLIKNHGILKIKDGEPKGAIFEIYLPQEKVAEEVG
ncbi:MAG: HAMP domain-containing sensor histidine kinase [Reichenbachiella sp.]